ncbi:MAG: hypothetical protein GY753_15540, partial [Gammaproteobacteria bacterium]|nr:hypothetical protein [Gammaproteobacteria bacterium]
PDLPDTLTFFSGNFGYNALTADPFGDGARLDPDWADTQTIPPSGVSATVVLVSPGSVEVTWTPVSYQADPGHYQVSYVNTSGDPYTNTVDTDNKSASSITVSGLTQGANYYFIVKTTTFAHANNQNDVTSVASDGASPHCTAQSQIPEAECNALVDLYYATDGTNWNNNSDWNLTNTPCSWHGVVCSNEGNVIHLWLHENNLSGEIPDFSNLPNLETLWLNG